jgi:hypothetical protein
LKRQNLYCSHFELGARFITSKIGTDRLLAAFSIQSNLDPKFLYNRLTIAKKL